MRNVVLVNLLVVLAFVGNVCAQDEPVEFGVRFQPQNFEPFSYNGFSYSGQTFRGGFGQPIQFPRITFPSFSSRAVRSEFLRRDRVTEAVGRRRERTRVDPISESRETVLARRFAPERIAGRTSTGDAILRRRVAVTERQRVDRSRLLGETRIATSPRSRVATNSPGLVPFPSRASRLAAVDAPSRTRTAESVDRSPSRYR